MDEIEKEPLKDVGVECINLMLNFLKKNKSFNVVDNLDMLLSISLNLLKHTIDKTVECSISIEALKGLKDVTEKAVSSFFDEAETTLKKRMN